MRQSILSVSQAKAKIEEGRKLLLAGDEDVLRKLPKGNWIGGTIPYFIIPGQGGVASRASIYATDVSDVVEAMEIVRYDHNSLSRVFSDGAAHGFSFMVIPAHSIAHLAFALNAPGYKDFGARPLVGWISGVHLEDLGEITPKVFNGVTGAILSEGALVLHADLIPGKVARMGIVNLFEQGDGDELMFPVDGFSARDVLVNGEKDNFAAYIRRNGLDTKLPLVADYNGVMANTSFQNVDDITEEVTFYAPVFKGVVYKHATPVEDYETAFKAHLDTKNKIDGNGLLFSCNCILNYIYSGLEGKSTDPFTGPVTFGEIASQLLNQTLVFLEICDAQC
ncbi:MAG: DUF6976 family protein [Acidobacteriota bacterium]